MSFDFQFHQRKINLHLLFFNMHHFRKDPCQIVAFRSYGTSTHLYAKGRALEDKNIDLSKKGFIALLWISYKHIETDLIRNSDLILTLPNGFQIKTRTDNQGYFLIHQTVE